MWSTESAASTPPVALTPIEPATSWFVAVPSHQNKAEFIGQYLVATRGCHAITEARIATTPSCGGAPSWLG